MPISTNILRRQYQTSNVRYQGQPGKHMLGLSSSQFDPMQKSLQRSELMLVVRAAARQGNREILKP